jgi:hypothetical protein
LIMVTSLMQSLPQTAYLQTTLSTRRQKSPRPVCAQFIQRNITRTLKAPMAGRLQVSLR